MKVTLTRLVENPVDAIEAAASNCYDSKPSKSGKIMMHCFQSGHHSVLEFADFTFHIEGVSRALLAQITRHRIACFAVRSQRYCSEDGFKYVVPHSIKSNALALTEYEKLMSKITDIYAYLQSHGIPNEDARMVLPNACETILECKMNGRELMHFFNERLCSRAQWEIRELALAMLKCLKEHDEQCLKFSQMCGPKCERFGKDRAFCIEKSSCGRYPTLDEITEGFYKYKQLPDKQNEEIMEEI